MGRARRLIVSTRPRRGSRTGRRGSVGNTRRRSIDPHSQGTHRAAQGASRGRGRIARPLTASGGPASRDAWAWLGLALLIEGHEDEALRCAEQALSYERNHPLATYVLAMGLAQRGDPDAASWLARARELSPGNSVIAYALERAERVSNAREPGATRDQVRVR